MDNYRKNRVTVLQESLIKSNNEGSINEDSNTTSELSQSEDKIVDYKSNYMAIKKSKYCLKSK